MWRFESPMYLNWLLLLPVMAGIFYFNYRKWQQKTQNTFGARVSPFLFQTISKRKALLKVFLLGGTLAAFILAQARLQMGQGQTEIKSEGVEIMIAVDVSNSMLAEDVRPSRLELAQKEIMRLLELMSGDKVGLIAFAGSAVLLSPLTVDKSALKMYVESLSPNNVETQGTMISKALQEAQDAFRRGGTESSEKSRVTKVVLVISDGEDHEPGAEVMTKKLAEQGIRVFTMAIGTEAGGKVPLRDPRGQLRDYMRDGSGQVVQTQVKGDFLRRLAEVGQGSFYHMTFGGDQMKSLKEDFDHLEKGEFDTLQATNYEEHFQIFIIVGLVLGMMELILGHRKKIPQIWKGRFPV